MNIYYSSLYYSNTFSSGANKRFDELGKRLLNVHEDNFVCIVTDNNRPVWCPLSNCVFIRPYSGRMQRLFSWVDLSVKLMKLPRGIFISDFMPVPLWVGRHYHFQTIYDLRNFDGFGRGGLGVFTEMFQRKQLSCANKIITISEFTSNAIQNYCSVSRQRIMVSYCGVDEKKIAVVNDGRNIDILYVATFESRKNHKNLINAIGLFEKPLRIIFVGSDNGMKADVLAWSRELEENGHSVTFLSQISEDELAEIYSQSKVFCFPSFYEGFGMPLIEAYQYGCKVACSDIEVFKEVTLNRAVYFDPSSPYDMYEKLRALLGSGALDDTLRKEIMERYSWDAIFELFNSEVVDKNS